MELEVGKVLRPDFLVLVVPEEGIGTSLVSKGDSCVFLNTLYRDAEGRVVKADKAEESGSLAGLDSIGHTKARAVGHEDEPGSRREAGLIRGADVEGLAKRDTFKYIDALECEGD